MEKDRYLLKWEKTRTYKRLCALEKRIKNSRQFKRERRELEERHLIRKDRGFRKFRKGIPSYPKEWDDFCNKWKISVDEFIRGRIKVNPPMSIKFRIVSADKFKIYMIIDESKSILPFTGTEYTDFKPLFLSMKNDLIGASSWAGQKKDKEVERRNKMMLRDFLRLRNKGVSAKKAIFILAKGRDLKVNHVKNVIYETSISS